MASKSANQKTDPDLRDGFAAARAICRRKMRGIELPAAFLPRAKRDGVFSVLALCTMIRDAVGGTHELGEMIHETLRQMSAGELQLPLPAMRSEQQRALCAASQTCERYEIPIKYFIDLTGAMRSPPLRFATWESLHKHCEAVGGNIVKIVSAVLGLTHSDGASRASQLGIAIELTRILRDIKSDLDAHKRIYVPLADMARAKYSERDLTSGVVTDALRDLLRFESIRAKHLYDEASRAIAWLADDGSRLFAAATIATGLSMLDLMEKRWRELLIRPPKTTTARIVRALPAAWRVARRDV